MHYLVTNPSLAVGLFSAVTSLLHAVVALYIHRHRSLSAARAAFRAAFSNALFDLRELQNFEPGRVHDILDAAYPYHEAAVADFRYQLGWFRRWRLQRRWMTYRYRKPRPPELPSEDHRYRLCHYIGSDPESEERKCRKAISAIEKLLS